MIMVDAAVLENDDTLYNDGRTWRQTLLVRNTLTLLTTGLHSALTVGKDK